MKNIIPVFEDCNYLWQTNGKYRFRIPVAKRVFDRIAKNLVNGNKLTEWMIRNCPTFNDVEYYRGY